MTKKKGEVNIVQPPGQTLTPEAKASLEKTLGMKAVTKMDTAQLVLKECDLHTFIYLRTAKTRKDQRKDQGQKQSHWRRSDTFFCRHCLRYTTVAREEIGPMMPEWYKD